MKGLLRAARRVVLLSVILIGLLLGLLKLVLTQPTLGALPFDLVERASPGNLERHVKFLVESVFPRNGDHPENLEAAAHYIARGFTASGLRTTEQIFEVRGSTYRNVIGVLGPESAETIVIGAHYDVFGDLPGADDNASGTAAILELGRAVSSLPVPVRVELVAYCLEEPPFFGSTDMGSAVHARSLRDAGRNVRAMISVEMIGFYTEVQPWDSLLLQALYPTRGDFVMVVGRWQDRRLTRLVKMGMRGTTDIRIRSLVAPRIPGLDASDHRSYWDQGYEAIMLTDTAYIRNHNYHTEFDTPETLDYDRMAGVVDGLAGAIMALGNSR